MFIRIIVGGLVAVIIVTAVGVLFTPATPQESLQMGTIAGAIIATVNWFLEEQKRDNL